MRSGCNVTDISDLYTKKYNTCGFNHLRQGKLIEENFFFLHRNDTYGNSKITLYSSAGVKIIFSICFHLGFFQFILILVIMCVVSFINQMLH